MGLNLHFSLKIIKINETIKGIIIVTVIGLGTLIVSILQGGNNKSFNISMIVLGLSLLYFNKKVIMVYMCIYMPICVIVAFINPQYIVGKDGNPKSTPLFIAIYLLLGALMIIATNNGEKLIKTSKDNSELLKKKADVLNDVLSKLYNNVLDGKNSITQMQEYSNNIQECCRQMALKVEETFEATVDANNMIISVKDNMNENYNATNNVSKSFDIMSEP